MKLALALLGVQAAVGAAPTAGDLEWARTKSMPGNFTHCVVIKDVACSPGDVLGRYGCSYREYARHVVWPKKNIVVDQVNGQWVKVAGDTPKCAVMDIDFTQTDKK